jgi:hypothetical protein
MKYNIRLIPVILSLVFPVLLFTWCCTKPTKDFVININSDILSYTATLQFTNAAQIGTVPVGLGVSLDGDDEPAIYDYSGFKALRLNNGMLTVGVAPQSNPTNNTLSFNIKANAANYLPVNVPVNISHSTKNQNFLVPMVNINSTPAGVVAAQPVATISNGTATTPVTAATTTNANTTTTVSITVPTGTQFRNAAGNTITGSSVKTVLAAFDPAQPTAMLTLPGGQVQTEVTGGASPSVFFLPAGFATIIMTVGTTEVKNFSTPVNIQMGLNAATFNPITNANIKAGDLIDLYSYQVETGIWHYESAVTIVNAAGRLVINFTTNHLTTFLANVRGNLTPCTATPTVVFNAPAINDNSSDQFIVDIYATGTGNNPAPIFSQYLTIHDKDSLLLRKLPTGNVDIRVFRTDYDHYLLTDYRNRGTRVGGRIVNLCATASQTTILNITYTPGAYLSGTGAAVCPNDNTKIFLPPNGAQVYYRKSATTDSYRILGVVVKGAITTTLLTPGQLYDIKGNYSGRQIGRTNILITPGRSFLDSTHVLTTNSNLCQ